MKPFKVHTVNLTPDENDSEGLFLHTSFHDANEGKGKSEIFVTQELVLNSYANSVSMNLSYLFNPDTLRSLANQLEFAMINANKSLE